MFAAARSRTRGLLRTALASRGCPALLQCRGPAQITSIVDAKRSVFTTPPTTFGRLLKQQETSPFQLMRGFGSSSNNNSSDLDYSGMKSQISAVLGAQWGDEGKGKLVDILAQRYDYVCRFNGGSNAGHTIVVDGKKYPFHLLPCGLLYPGKINIIGNGVVVHVPTMMKELDTLEGNGITDWRPRLKISTRAHLLFDAHQLVDGQQEAALAEGEKIGTTGRGIGPCYSSKTQRNGVRAGELVDFPTFEVKYRKLIKALQSQYGNFEYDVEEELTRYREYAKILVPLLTDSVSTLAAARAEGATILAEGANATLLDVDFGTYPFVTSSSTSVGGISTGLGLPPNTIETRFGIVKAYTTRVGEGPFPTELFDEVGAELRDVGHEYGTTTGRPRRCGWLDLPVVHYSHALNDYTSINLTKLDVMSDLKTLRIATHYKINGERLPKGYMPSLLSELEAVEVEYEEHPGWESDISHIRTFENLPENAQKYVLRVQELLGVHISHIGVGPGRLEMATNF